MNKSISYVAAFIFALGLTACNKQPEKTSNNVSEVTTEKGNSVEQQAAIDALDQPVLDEKNKDVPEEISNADVDVATIDTHPESSSEAVQP